MQEKEHIRDLLNDPNDIQKQRKVMTIIDRIAGINDQTDGTVRSAVEETDPERGPSRTVVRIAVIHVVHTSHSAYKNFYLTLLYFI